MTDRFQAITKALTDISKALASAMKRAAAALHAFNEAWRAATARDHQKRAELRRRTGTQTVREQLREAGWTHPGLPMSWSEVRKR